MLNSENISDIMPWLEMETNFCHGCQRLQQELDEKKKTFEAKFHFIKEKIKNAHSLITHYKTKNRQFDLHLKKCGEKSKLFDRVNSECTRYENELIDLLKTLEPLKQENKALSDELRNQSELNQDLEHKLAALEVMCQQYKTSSFEKKHSIKNKLEEYGSLAKEVNILKTCVIKQEKDLKKAKDEVIVKRTLLKRKTRAINAYQKRESKHKKYLLTFASILEDHKLLAKSGARLLKNLKCEKDPLSASDTDVDPDHLKLEQLLLEEDSNTPSQNLSMEEIFMFFKWLPPILSPMSPSLETEKDFGESEPSIKNNSNHKQVHESLEFLKHTPSSFHELSNHNVENVSVIAGSHEYLSNSLTVAHDSFNYNSDIELSQTERTSNDNSKCMTQHLNESLTEAQNPQRNTDIIMPSKMNGIPLVSNIIESQLSKNSSFSIVSSENSVPIIYCDNEDSMSNSKINLFTDIVCNQEKINGEKLYQKYSKNNFNSELPDLNKTSKNHTSSNKTSSQELQNVAKSPISNSDIDLDQRTSNHLQENKSYELVTKIPQHIINESVVEPKIYFKTVVDVNLQNPLTNTLLYSQSVLELNLNKLRVGSNEADLKQEKTHESTKNLKESKNICDSTNLQLPNSVNPLNEVNIKNISTDCTSILNKDSNSHQNSDNKIEIQSQPNNIKFNNLEIVNNTDLYQPKTVISTECLGRAANICAKTSLSHLDFTKLNNCLNTESNILEKQINIYNKDPNVYKTPDNISILPQSDVNFSPTHEKYFFPQINPIENISTLISKDYFEQFSENNGMTHQQDNLNSQHVSKQAILNDIKDNEKLVEVVKNTSEETIEDMYMNIPASKHSNENEESGVNQKNKICNLEKSEAIMKSIQEHLHFTNSIDNQLNLENITTDVNTSQQSNICKEGSNIQTNTDNETINYFLPDVNEFPLCLEKNSSLAEQQLIQSICMEILSEVCASTVGPDILEKGSDSFSEINETIRYRDHFNNQHVSKQDTYADNQNNNSSIDLLMNAEAKDLITTKCDVCSEESISVQPEEDIKAVLPLKTIELDENEINRRLKMFALQLPIKTEKESDVKEYNEYIYPEKIEPIMQIQNVEQPLDLTISSKNQEYIDTTLLQPKLNIPKKDLNIMLNSDFKTNIQHQANVTELTESQIPSSSLEFEMMHREMQNRSIKISEIPSIERELEIMQQDKSEQPFDINETFRHQNISQKLQEPEQIDTTDNSKSNEFAINLSSETQIDLSIKLNKREIDIKSFASKVAIGNEEFDGDKKKNTNVYSEQNESTMKDQSFINSVLDNIVLPSTDEVNREFDNPCHSCICHVKERDDQIDHDTKIDYVQSTVEKSGELNDKATDSSIFNVKVIHKNLEQDKNTTLSSESLKNVYDSFNAMLESETLNIFNKKTIKAENENIDDTFKKKKILESELNGLSLELKKTLVYYNRLSVDVALTNNLPDISLNDKKDDGKFLVEYDNSKSHAYLPLGKNKFLNLVKNQEKESSVIDSQEYDHVQLDNFSNSEKITEHLNEAFKKIAETNTDKEIFSMFQSNYPLEQFPHSIAALSSLPTADLSNVLLTIDRLSPLPPSPSPTSLSTSSFLLSHPSPVLPTKDLNTHNKSTYNSSGKDYSSPPLSSLSASPYLLSTSSPVIDNKDFCIKNKKKCSSLAKRQSSLLLSSISTPPFSSPSSPVLSNEDFQTKNKKTYSILLKSQLSPPPSSLPASPFLLSPASPVISIKDFQAKNKKTYNILTKRQSHKKMLETTSIPFSNRCNIEDINLPINSTDTSDPQFCYKKRKSRHKLIIENCVNTELNNTDSNKMNNKLLSNKTCSNSDFLDPQHLRYSETVAATCNGSTEHHAENYIFQRANPKLSSKRKLIDLDGLVQKKQCLEIPEPTTKNISELPKGELFRMKNKKVETIVDMCIKKLLKNDEPDIHVFVIQFSKCPSANCLAQKLAKRLQKTDFDFTSTLLSHITNFTPDKPLMAAWELSLVEVLLAVSQTSEMVDLISLVVKKLHLSICKENVSTSARATMCRINVALLRYQGNLDAARILCYDIMYSKLQDSLILLLSIAAAWSLTLQMQTDNCPVDAVFQLLIFRTSLADQEKFDTALQHLIVLCNLKPPSLNANDLTKLLFSQLKLNLTPKSSGGYFLNSWNFNILKAIELLARYEGWEWINNFVVRQLIWPLLQQWSRQEADSQPTDQQVICSFLMLGHLCKQCPVENIYSVRQIMTTLQLFFNIIMRPHQKVSLPVQLSALEALLQLAPFNPKITSAICRKWFLKNKAVPKAISHKYEIFKSVFESNEKLNVDQAAIT